MYDEKSQAQSFLKEFFEVFGIDTVTQATFEHRVKFSDGSQVANGQSGGSTFGSGGSGGGIYLWTKQLVCGPEAKLTANAGASGGFETAAEAGTVYFGKLPGGILVFVR